MNNCRKMFLFYGTLFGLIFVKVICNSSKCRVKLLNDYQTVPDSAFSATSCFIYTNSLEKKADFSAKAARESYDKENEEFAWCPSNQVETSLSEYLQIDLGRLTMIQVVQTKGRFAQGAGKEFTPFYRIRYSRDNGTNWRDYKKFKEKGFEKILNGPTDAFLDAFETLAPPIVARIIRIFPYSLKSRRVCLKLQLFGCQFQSDLLEYRMLQGSAAIIQKDGISELSNNFGVLQSFYDNGYDGKLVDGHLFGGLGLLTDYTVGVDFTHKEKEALNFIGWCQQRYHHTKRSISIRFVFFNRRNFTSLTLHSFSKPSWDIEYFSRIDLSFSNDDKIFHKSVQHDNLLPHYNRRDHSITVNITGNQGKFVNITLYFPFPWLLLSEIVFSSTSMDSPVMKNHSVQHANNNDKQNGSNSMYVTSSSNIHNSKIDYATSKPSDKTVSNEIIYLLAILLCLLLGIITAICSFWIIIKKRRSHRRRSIKKQAMALCSQASFIPYNHTSKSVQCLPSSLTTRPVYPSFTVDRRNYVTETLRNNPHLPGSYMPQSTNLDQNCYMSKQSIADANIYTSIVGSDNDSLSPEYATTSITVDPSLQSPNFENSPYLPPPIEPIRPQIFHDSFMDTSDCPAFYYPHPTTIPNIQDQSNINFWRFNSQSMANNNKGINLPSQMSFNDFSKDARKADLQSTHDNFHIPSIYSDLPRIHSHY